jgi:hypothetical protein
MERGRIYYLLSVPFFFLILAGVFAAAFLAPERIHELLFSYDPPASLVSGGTNSAS